MTIQELINYLEEYKNKYGKDTPVFGIWEGQIKEMYGMFVHLAEIETPLGKIEMPFILIDVDDGQYYKDYLEKEGKSNG